MPGTGGWASSSHLIWRIRGRKVKDPNLPPHWGVLFVLAYVADKPAALREFQPKWAVLPTTKRQTGQLIGPWLSTQKRTQFMSAVGLHFDRPPTATFAWAAGLFDAEGSTSLSDRSARAGYKAIESAVTQGGLVIPEELVRFANCVAIGQINGPYEQDGANELVYRWRIHTVDDVRRLLHVLLPWLGDVRRRQAFRAIAVVDAQPVLHRGRVEWGSHKAMCIHGHEYATARLRPYVSRSPNGRQRRPSHQCLVCVREQARARRRATKMKIGGPSAADQEVHSKGDATC